MVVYEMLRGRVPFEGRKTGALVNQICAAKVILTHLLEWLMLVVG